MSALLDRLPTLATTGVGSLPFTDPAQAAKHASRAYTVPFCPQLYRLDGDMVSEWLGADPRRCGWTADRDRELPAAWDPFVDRMCSDAPAHAIVKLQVTGPVTLAVALERCGDRVGAGSGVLELAGEIATWLAANVAGQVRLLREIGIGVLLMVDEPGLAQAGIRDGDLTLWDPLRGAAPAWGLHVCGHVPWDLVAGIELDVFSFDAPRQFSGDARPVLRTIMQRGGRIARGVLDPAGRVDVTSAGQLVVGAISSLVRPGLRLERATQLSLFTPTCGTGRLSTADERLVAAALTATAHRSAALVGAMTRGRTRLNAQRLSP